ncbi:MAG: NAD-glutamate dehydrogenase, partial [Deferribacterales bacterium]
MYNISFLTYNEIKQSLQEEKQYSRQLEYLKRLEQNDPVFYKFSILLLKKLPENLISHLSENDFIKLFKLLFDNLNGRKKRKYYIDSLNGLTEDLTFGNISIIAISTDDRPFLVDSLREYFYEINMNQQIIVHPILNVKRNNKGDIIDISEPHIGSKNESFVLIFIPNISNNEIEKIKDEISEIYENVITVVDDHPKMSSFLKQLSSYFENVNIETANFLNWLIDDNFILQGVRIISDIKDTKTFSLQQMGIYKFNRTANIIPSIIDAVLNNKVKYIDNLPLIIDKAIFKSKVKKRTHYDRIIMVDKSNKGLNIITIVGVFTKDALKSSPLDISLVKNNVKKVMDHFNFVAGSHDYKWLLDIIDTFPKIEIFNFNEQVLIEILQTIFSIQGKNQIRVYYKTFLPQKNLYLFIAIPSEKYSTELINNIKTECEKFFNAKTIDISIREDEHGYDFIHFNFYTREPQENIDEAKLKRIISEQVKDWNEYLYEILNNNMPGYEADKLYYRFYATFPENYKVKCSVEEAYHDIKIISSFKTDIESAL